MISHSKFKRDHNESRKWVCVPCGTKLTRLGRLISQEHIELVITHINSNYDPRDVRFPTGICDGCRKKLSKSTGEEPSLPNMPNYEDIVLPRFRTILVKTNSM